MLSGLAYAYVYFFRGTPLIAQTFLIYYGTRLFRLNSRRPARGASSAESGTAPFSPPRSTPPPTGRRSCAVRLEAVPRGQWDGAAARSACTSSKRWRSDHPAAGDDCALRPYGNEIILMDQGSAIVAIITVYDLMGQTRYIYSRSFDFQSYPGLRSSTSPWWKSGATSMNGSSAA